MYSCFRPLEVLNRIYEENNDIRNDINKSIKNIQQVFSVCFGFLSRFLNHNLWLAVFYYYKQKLKIMLLVIAAEHSQKLQKQKK